METDRDFIGHGGEVGPGPFADGEIRALDDYRAVEDALAAFLLEGEGRDGVLGPALDAQLAGQLISVAAQGLDAGGHEPGGGIGLDVEPLPADDLFVGLAGSRVDAGEVDLDIRLGSLQPGGIEGNRGGKRPEFA